MGDHFGKAWDRESRLKVKFNTNVSRKTHPPGQVNTLLNEGGGPYLDRVSVVGGTRDHRFLRLISKDNFNFKNNVKPRTQVHNSNANLGHPVLQLWCLG